MLMLSQCPRLCFSVMQLLQYTLFLGAIYCFVRALRQHLSAGYIGLFIGNLALQYFVTQLLLEYASAHHFSREVLPIGKILDLLPLWAVILWLLLWISLTLFSISRLRRYNTRHVTPQVIKASLDDLATGLCFSRSDGSVILSNRRMDALCLALTGKSLLSSTLLWDAIQTAGENPQPDGSIILRLGETVWNVTRTKLQTDISPIWEISAADVSEEYRLIRALEQDNRQLKANGRRLREYAKNVEQLTTETEILNTKIHIHGETGDLLYAAVHSMEPGASRADREQTLRRWRQANTLLQTDSSTPESSSFEDLCTTAQAIGVTLTLDGALPTEKKAEQLCEAIAHECLTNTLRHAHGNCVVLSVREDSGTYTVHCTNNGDIPAAPIREGGGLSSLRRQLERSGGTMQIDSSPKFRLTAIIPKGESNGKDPCADR